MNLTQVLECYESNVDRATSVLGPSLHELSSIAVNVRDWVELVKLEVFDNPAISLEEIVDYQSFLELCMTPLVKKQVESAFMAQASDSESDLGLREFAALGFTAGKVTPLDAQHFRDGDTECITSISEKYDQSAVSKQSLDFEHDSDFSQHENNSNIMKM